MASAVGVGGYMMTKAPVTAQVADDPIATTSPNLVDTQLAAAPPQSSPEPVPASPAYVGREEFTDPAGYYSFTLPPRSRMASSSGSRDWALLQAATTSEGDPTYRSLTISFYVYPNGFHSLQQVLDAQNDALKTKRTVLIAGSVIDGITSLQTPNNDPRLGQTSIMIPMEGGVLELLDPSYQKGGLFDQVVGSLKLLKKSKDTSYTKTTPAAPAPVSASSTKINGEVVPPEPDATLNDAILAGIDVNNNRVRDDVERILAEKFGGTPDYVIALAYAKSVEKEVVMPTPKTRAEALQYAANEMCSAEGASAKLGNFSMYNVVVNTTMRKKAFRDYNDVLIGYGSTELPPCTK